MEYISTSSLASEMDIEASELFTTLKGLGWIERKNDKWCITDLGKKQGGKMQSDSRFGEYVVWPENLELPGNGPKDSSKFLNPTAIGKHFNVSSQKINLVLSELGFIENDNRGWEITKLGKNIGGKQLKHDQSGKFYVMWPQSILSHKSLVDVFAPPSATPPPKEEISPAENFRKKYPANFRTQDGHFVRSKSEAMIDDFLYIHGLVHSYEKKLPILDDVVCDFYIPPGPGRPKAIYIEYWGLENDPKYQERKQAKIKIYQQNELSLIQLNDRDIQNLDDNLTRKLVEFKIAL